MCTNKRNESVPSSDSQGLRLPKDIKPENYKIQIVLKESTSEFTGNIQILANVYEDTDRISLHRKNMTITKITVSEIDESTAKQEIKLTSTLEEINSEENTNSVITIQTDTQMKKDTKILLEIAYTAYVSEDMAGFYKSEELDKNGQLVNCIYSTQFEATSARLAFPCWDEPEFKSTFDISISAPSKYTVLSNGKLERQTNHPDLMKDKEFDDTALYTTHFFKTTPIMSTYLVAWVIGEMDYIEKERIRVYTPKGQQESGEFALDVGVRCLKYFEEYFGIEYQMDKLDMVAIPNFSAGAMENWGLVTYRSSSLLYRKGSTTEMQKLYIAETVCHELAHQWFGNLVTMRWWNDLWLNEGFATWAGTLATAAMAKDINLLYDPWVNFLESDITQGMIMDGKLSTHPINVKVESAGEISSIFDAISYHKGGSVIHMLSKYLGENRFKEGLRKYIKKYKYKNTETKDLWRELDESDGKITEAMDKWINTAGFPKISVDVEEDKFLLRQTRYLPAADTKETEETKDTPDTKEIADTKTDTWMVFLTKKRFMKDGGEQEESILLSEKETRLNAFDGLSMFNVNATGFYLMEYSEEALKRHIVPLLESDRLNSLDRYGIFRDMISLSVDGHRDVRYALDIIKYIKKDEKYFVVRLVSEFLSMVLKRFDSDKAVELAVSTELSGFLQKYLDGVDDFESTPSDEEERKLKMIAVGELAVIKDSPVQKEVARLAQSNELGHVHKDYKMNMYISYAKYGGKEAYEYMYKIITSSTANENEKLRAITAISYSPDEIDRVFKLFAQKNMYIKNQDKFRMVTGIARHPDQMKTLKMFTDSFSEIVKIFDTTRDNIDRFVQVFIGSQRTREGIEECRKFFGREENIQDAWMSGIRKGLDQAEISNRFVEDNREVMKEWAEHTQGSAELKDQPRVEVKVK